ncbi:hypothetical protein M9H77_33392 [Catharanthus roseus]|uniref:Uncharacterized protein n=1 Tax=Catharanthus roseus TaxID=4058 RepID=A0ACB9ZME8_CATRO|nr:hypothetical protein M9H77_33392 [Catharanthus roseus]
MARFTVSILLLLSIISLAGTIGTTTATSHGSSNNHRRSTNSRTIVEAQCRGTLYPRLCIESLFYFVSNSTVPTAEELAQISLKVSLVKARYTRSYVAKVAAELKQIKAKEYPAVKDCLDQINDGVGQISNAVKELGRLFRADRESVFSWHRSNVETWVSTALTDALMCMDSFPGNTVGSKRKAIIKAKVLNVAQATSNALAFFNRFVARHRASRATKP